MKAKSFGVRGMNAQERADVNPYLGHKVPLGGQVPRRAAATAEGFKAAGPPVTSPDEGLRAFMLQVHDLMFAGLCLTGATAWGVHSLAVTTDLAMAGRIDGATVPVGVDAWLTQVGVWLWGTPISYAVCFGPLVLCLVCGPIQGLPARVGGVIYAIIATLIGVSFSSLALVYTGSSMTMVFFVTAAAFGGLSLLGYTTRADLTGWGSFLWMGLFGIIVAAVANLWFASDMLRFVICSAGVIVFAGFTAYDTQQIKEAYSADMDPQERNAIAIAGALDLYLDFVNLFRFLLYFLGAEEE